MGCSRTDLIDDDEDVADTLADSALRVDAFSEPPDSAAVPDTTFDTARPQPPDSTPPPRDTALETADVVDTTPPYPDDPTTAPCLTGGNVLYYYASEPKPWLTPTGGPITDATWIVYDSIFPTSPSFPKRLINFDIRTASRSFGLGFSSRKLDIDLFVAPYEGAMRIPFESPGHPGLDLTTGSSGCNQVFGRFEIVTLEWSGTAVKKLTATFAHRCDYNPNVSRGCVHFER